MRLMERAMIITCSTNFESIFYATLLSALKGYPILHNSELNNYADAVIDIDSLDWEKVYSDYVCRFGSVSWYERSYADCLRFKKKIESEIAGVSSIHQAAKKVQMALKYGIKFEYAHSA